MTFLERPGHDCERNLRFARWRFYSYERAPLFRADWTDLVFHHFSLNPETLGPFIPFELDLFEGRAFVSLVAFRTTRMYVDRLGEWTRWFHFPISHHSFLNVRTYVKHRGEPGIYFIKEYVNSLPAVPVGRFTYGLPYTYADMGLDHEDPAEGLFGEIETGPGNVLRYFCEPEEEETHTCPPDSLEAFLCERYSAFTDTGGIRRVFRILHKPWEIAGVKTTWDDLSLLEHDFPWFCETEPCSSAWTRGAFDVAISRPRRIRR